MAIRMKNTLSEGLGTKNRIRLFQPPLRFLRELSGCAGLVGREIVLGTDSWVKVLVSRNDVRSRSGIGGSGASTGC